MPDLIPTLKEKVLNVRRDIITMLAYAGSGHTGGSLSCADFASVLMFHELKRDPRDPNWDLRDFLFYSNGHVSPVNYSCLAEAGYFPKRDLLRFRQLDGQLQGHPCHETPGIEVGSGSLGQGLSIGCGAALAAKRERHPRRVYVIMGDGELQEGMCWEAAMFGAHYRLNNLCAIVDRNFKQIDGDTETVMALEPLADKWTAFGWNVIATDGHDLAGLIAAYEQARAVDDKPTVLLLRTIMGKGVSFMENDHRWHGKAPSKEQAEAALRELGTNLDEWTEYLKNA